MLVISPLSADTEKEILIKSDDVNNDVILNVLKAINARVKKFDRNHAIFYVAGYSQNGEKIYIDRHMPKTLRHGGRRIATDRFLILHEVIEKALLDGPSRARPPLLPPLVRRAARSDAACK